MSSRSEFSDNSVSFYSSAASIFFFIFITLVIVALLKALALLFITMVKGFLVIEAGKKFSGGFSSAFLMDSKNFSSA